MTSAFSETSPFSTFSSFVSAVFAVLSLLALAVEPLRLRWCLSFDLLLFSFFGGEEVMSGGMGT
jgi:hypothetical protein